MNLWMRELQGVMHDLWQLESATQAGPTLEEVKHAQRQIHTFTYTI